MGMSEVRTYDMWKWKLSAYNDIVKMKSGTFASNMFRTITAELWDILFIYFIKRNFEVNES